MENWNERLITASDNLQVARKYVILNGEYFAAGLFLMGLIALAFIGWRTWKNGERERIMKRSAELDEQSKVADALSNTLMALNLEPSRLQFYTKRVGKACGLRDMIPQKIFPAKRTFKKPSDEPEAVNTEVVNDIEIKEGKNVLALFTSGKAAT